MFYSFYDQEVRRLLGIWQRLIAGTGGKQRDCVFTVKQRFISYETDPIWIVSHDGYISDEYYSEHKSYEEALMALSELLQKMINDYKEDND